MRYLASFHQFLANLALNISKEHNKSLPNIISMNHHSHAIQSVRNKLRDPSLGTQDDMIAIIIAFVSYSVSIVQL